MNSAGAAPRDWRRLIRPEEAALVAFVLALAAVVVATGQLPATFAPPLWRAGRRLHVYFLGGVLLLGALSTVKAYRLFRRRASTSRADSLVRALRGRGRLLRDFGPFYGVLVLYEALRDLTPRLLPALADATLIRIDRALLGVDAALWIGQFATPLLSEVMAVCYGAYYLLPIVLATAIYSAGRRALFRDLMLAGVITSVLGFTGYLLVPAVGPYVFQAELFPTRLPGGAYCPRFIKTIDDLRGVARDCFPSLHVAHTVVVLTFAYRFRRWVFLSFLPVALGLAVSTVYLRMHYVIDLLAGALLGAVAAFVAPRINRLW